MASDDVPTLDAHHVSDPDQPQWVAWCPWCEGFHRHGPYPGHRVAHCHDASSPLKDRGYELRCVGAVDDEAEVQPLGLGLPSPIGLRGGLDDAREAFRAAVLRGVLGISAARARQSCFNQKLGDGVRLAVVDRHWWIERPGAERIAGVGWVDLAARLHGVPAGVAAVRIIEAAIGATVDAEAALAVAAALDDWTARGAAPRAWRR